jgi:hypothetical protein
MSLAVVIPLVHPRHDAVTEYAVVERLLRATVASVLRQQDDRVRVVVAGHRVPEWGPAMGERVLFLDLGDHPALAPGKARDGREFLDKAKKLATGSLVADRLWRPDHLMLMDADDFIHVSLADALAGGGLGPGGKDGYVLTRGYHALLTDRTETLAVRAAIAVESFDRTCGSCRIFRADALMHRIEVLAPGAGQLLPGQTRAMLAPRVVERVVTCLAAALEQGAAGHRAAQALGRHMWREDGLDLQPVRQPLAAKGCGHGNHVGWRGGAVHWHRATGALPVDRFMGRFGLEGQTGVVARPDMRVTLRGTLAAPVAHFARRATGRLRRSVRAGA